jgi:cytochrome b561
MAGMRSVNASSSFAGWRYSTPAIVLHWVLAALIVFMAALGWWMMTVEHEPGGERWIALHQSIGLVVFTLVLLRLVWRLTHRPEPLPPGMPAWQVQLSRLMHWLLYAAMVLLPVTGIVGASHTRAGLHFFGLALPAWAAPDRATAKQFFNIHSILVWVLVALVAMHVLAALKHLLLDGDEVFTRMWPNRRS